MRQRQVVWCLLVWIRFPGNLFDDGSVERESLFIHASLSEFFTPSEYVVKAYVNSTKVSVTGWDKPNRSLFSEVLVVTHEHNVVLHNRKESTRRHGGQRHPSNDSEQAAGND
jgi:hypothetical protein